MKDVRCRRNQYNTLLFRYSEKGIYVFCKDCWSHEQNKKGTQHLIPWSSILGLMIRFVLNIEPTKLPEGIADGFDSDNLDDTET